MTLIINSSAIGTIKSPFGNIISSITISSLNDTLKLSDKECTVFELIKSDLSINTDQIVEKTGFGRATVMRAIKVLKEKGLVDRNGSKKTGSWELVKVEN